MKTFTVNKVFMTNISKVNSDLSNCSLSQAHDSDGIKQSLVI